MTDINEIKKRYEEIATKIDKSMDITNAIHNAFVDGAEGDGIKNDFHPKAGSGSAGDVPKGKVLDGAEGGKLEKMPSGKAGSGSTGDIPKAKEPFVDGAQGTKIRKI